ncbi:uncharacterized protein PGTG_20948 [Puccinia graminis f. sp. tritici CRL 75-36-700-3]|uniref:Uncharacterized protein n=1 Tax=Puccinia graminis f. sp. tritici (strain CRL 75-36-700-3 / race SCCL) TaxID=418459 RepID=H6QPY0_PUCGT|nr:uncharacterized protein PGTG_20948 [Puccinia graminis f. sp. tritici CRL 75-36-700-3]EHS64482.1 hypothetical protein PGTG_20948 [Puccinia graminis f. sp. tritici CRL 75-36-700-3]
MPRATVVALPLLQCAKSTNLSKSLASEGLVALAGVECHSRKARASEGGT